MNAGNYATTTKNVIMNYAFKCNVILNENLDQVIEKLFLFGNISPAVFRRQRTQTENRYSSKNANLSCRVRN